MSIQSIHVRRRVSDWLLGPNTISQLINHLMKTKQLVVDNGLLSGGGKGAKHSTVRHGTQLQSTILIGELLVRYLGMIG